MAWGGGQGEAKDRGMWAEGWDGAGAGAEDGQGRGEAEG